MGGNPDNTCMAREKGSKRMMEVAGSTIEKRGGATELAERKKTKAPYGVEIPPSPTMP